MNTSELKKGIRARLAELANKRKAIEAEESALSQALGALGGKAVAAGKQTGGHTGNTRTFRGRVKRAERERQLADLFSQYPDREFKPVEFEEFGIPGSSADGIMRDWISKGRLIQTGTTPRGAPIAKAAGDDEPVVEQEPEPEPPDQPAEPDPEPPPKPAREPRAATKASAEARKLVSEEKRRTERMQIVNLLSNHPEGLILKEIAERIGVEAPRLTVLMQGMEASVETETTKRDGRAVKLVKLKRRGSGPREAVTAPGDGTREGRLR